MTATDRPAADLAAMELVIAEPTLLTEEARGEVYPFEPVESAWTPQAFATRQAIRAYVAEMYDDPPAGRELGLPVEDDDR